MISTGASITFNMITLVLGFAAGYWWANHG